MDIEEVHKLDPELLQLPTGLSVKSNPLIAEELFSHWLSLPDTSRLVLFPSLCGGGTLFHLLCVCAGQVFD